MEQQIKLAAKLYRCRDSMKGLFGTEYAANIEPYIKALNDYARRENLDTLKAVLQICDMPKIINGLSCALFMAAAVEIIEPSESSHNPPAQ